MIMWFFKINIWWEINYFYWLRGPYDYPPLLHMNAMFLAHYIQNNK